MSAILPAIRSALQPAIRAVYGSSSAWSPLTLFAASEVGVWYDPSDFSTMFQDSAGTTPVTAVGQPVGKILDKSGNLKHATQATAGLRPTLVDSALPRLRFNSDAMQTATIDFSGTSCITVVTTIRKDDDGDGVAIELSVNGFSTAGGFYIAAANAPSSVQDYGFVAKGTSALGLYPSTPMPGPRADLLTVVFDISASSNEITARINGEVAALSTVAGTTLGTGNFGNHKLNLGARDAAGNWIDGTIGRTIVIGRALTAEETVNAEAWARRGGMTVVAALGDSTIASYGGGYAIPLHMNCIPAIIAAPGNTIAQQKTAWTARSDKATFDVVVVEVGLNDTDPAEAASIAIARLQDLIDTINADVSVPVYVAQMTPCRQRLIDTYGSTDGLVAYQKWLDMNAAIAGSGATPITDVDGRITSHAAQLNDGDGNLAAIYDIGDHIHENDLGRAIIATTWTETLAGLL